MCITVTGGNYTVSRDLAVYYQFKSSEVGGRYAEGSWRTITYRGVVEFTPEQNKEKAIQATLSYLGGNFQNVYGRPMTRYDICGIGEDPAITAVATAAAAAAERARVLAEAEKKVAEENARIAAELAAKEAISKLPDNPLLPGLPGIGFLTTDIKVTETISIKPIYIVFAGMAIFILYFILKK